MLVMSIKAPTRRTFSGGGKPRKAGPREPNGRLRPAPRAEREADIVAVVLAQPHRRGSGDDRRRWAIGRLILDGKVRAPGIASADLERAAEMYALAYADLRWVIDSRRPWATGGGRDRPEPTPDQDTAIRAHWSAIERVLRDAGRVARDAVEKAVLDDPSESWEAPFWITYGCGLALAALAKHFEICK
jgi:hypothetical protein